MQGGAKRAVAVLVVSAAGLFGTQTFEGRSLTAYHDTAGIVTICDGHTKTARMGQVATNALCDKLLLEDTADAQAAVRRLVKVPVTQSQYDALVDFTFNLGAGNLSRSTLLKKANAGNCWGAGSEFPKWRYAGGVELPGLLKRRNYERALWETGC
jgi:lysozyme